MILSERIKVLGKTIQEYINSLNNKEDLVNSITFNKWFYVFSGITDDNNLIITLNTSKSIKSIYLKVNSNFTITIYGVGGFNVDASKCGVYRLDNGSLYLVIPRNQVGNPTTNSFFTCRLGSDLTIQTVS